MRLRFALPVVAVAAGITLSACSSTSTDHSGMNMGGGANTTMGGSATTPMNVPAGAAFNSADVTFAQNMIPHHAQAVEMADFALKNSANADVKKIAEQIKAAQSPEIEKMTGWLKMWNQTVPDPKAMDSGMNHSGGMMMPGMMSASDMSNMSKESGTKFDRMFLSSMILHHKGAVEMAQKEVAEGKFQPTKDLAQEVIAGQQAEITEMNNLIASLPA